MLAYKPILIAACYYVCFVFVFGLITLVGVAPVRRRSSSKRGSEYHQVSAFPAGSSSTPRGAFLCIALALLVWQLTLFLESHVSAPALQLWLGRTNFASVVVATYCALHFVQSIARTSSVRSPEEEEAYGKKRPYKQTIRYVLSIETTCLTLATLFTPLVDESESVVDGHPISVFGPIFFGYIVHVLGYLAATIILAIWSRPNVTIPNVRAQLILVALGCLATSGIALITNVVLPYRFNEFRFCDVGAFSAILFLMAVAYAVFAYRLFDLRMALRATLVYGVLLSLVLGGYSSAVFVTAQYVTGKANADALTQFVVLLIAFSVDPIRRFLLAKTDRLLFGGDTVRIDSGSARLSKRRKALGDAD